MMELDRQNRAAAHWSRQQYETLFLSPVLQLSERFIVVAENIVAQDPSEMQAETVSGAAQRLLAFLVASRVEKEWELENIVVERKFQRLGVGTRLLRNFVDCARANHDRGIFLEVRETNQSARAMYQKTGFAEIGSRKRYYSDPTEDAILYRLSLI